MQASIDACIPEMTYDLWRCGRVTEEHYRTTLAAIAARRRQRLDPADARRRPLPFPPESPAARER